MVASGAVPDVVVEEQRLTGAYWQLERLRALRRRGCCCVDRVGNGPALGRRKSRVVRARDNLDAAGIESRRYYVHLACEEPALGDQRQPPSRFPEAANARDEALSIPVRPSCAPATIREIARVIRVIVTR